MARIKLVEQNEATGENQLEMCVYLDTDIIAQDVEKALDV